MSQNTSRNFMHSWRCLATIIVLSNRARQTACSDVRYANPLERSCFPSSTQHTSYYYVLEIICYGGMKGFFTLIVHDADIGDQTVLRCVCLTILTSILRRKRCLPKRFGVQAYCHSSQNILPKKSCRSWLGLPESLSSTPRLPQR